ncbi:hypothetical protein L7F22_024993 [Adiantum nelumboides]|nr:hypothetical protein [Adiantum nelumboides]
MVDNIKENKMSIDDFDFAHEEANDDTPMLVNYLVTRLQQAMGNPALQEGCYWSDSDSDVEEGIDSKGHHKKLADIQSFLNMAMAAYDDKSMDKKFPYVRKSQLVKDSANPTILNKDKNITTDTEVHVCLLEDGSLAFAFRGTEFQFQDLRSLFGDLMTDLLVAQIPVEHYDASEKIAFRAAPSIKAHKGFQFAFGDVTRTPRPNENIRLVAEGLGARAPSVRRVICVGHSLGGALATLCAHWCRYVAYPQAQVWCVTIGSPRVGNPAFAQDFNQNVVTKGRSYRVVNKTDLISEIPRIDGPTVISFLSVYNVYKHVDGLIFLLSTHPTSKNTIRRRPRFLVHSYVDHLCDSYRDTIKKVLAAVSHLHHSSSLPPFE